MSSLFYRTILCIIPLRYRNKRKMVKISALVLGVIGAVAATTKTPPSSLQIGIKEKADPCVATAQNGDNLTMHYASITTIASLN